MTQTIGQLTLCGAELRFTRRRSPVTPHRHKLCDCSKLWSSDPVCHRCSCVACAKARAAWARRIEQTRKAKQ